MTAQVADVLQIDGRVLPLFTNPLEHLWSETHPRPRFTWPSTANYRGYVALWVIENGHLYLADIDGEIEIDEGGSLLHGEIDFMRQKIDRRGTGARPATLDLLFPGARGRVLAEWFSGELRVPEGRPIRYVHSGYQSIFERELHIGIQRGAVIETRLVNTGEENRRVREARQRDLDRALNAQAGEDGWLLCPHCNRKFRIHGDRWDGERHTRCGGRIRLGGPPSD